MLPKRHKGTKEDFATLRHGKSRSSSLFSARIIRNTGQEARISVVVSKKVAAKAITRNAIKRRVYSALPPSITKKTIFLAIYPKKGIDAAPFHVIKEDLDTLLAGI